MTKNLKILHAATFAHVESGVINQMFMEATAASRLGLDWTTRLYVPNDLRSAVPANIAVPGHRPHAVSPAGLVTTLGQRIGLRRDFYDWLTDVHTDYDCVLLRYTMNDPMLSRFMGNSKKPVVFVHHAMEGKLLAGSGRLGLARSWIESRVGKRNLQKAFGIVGVTQEILDYEIYRRGTYPPFSHVYPNGSIDEIGPVTDIRDDVPTFLFMAGQFIPGHGLDLLWDVIHGSTANVRVHLVGQVSPSMQKLISQDNRFVMHGHLDQDSIQEVAAHCWLGLSALAIDREGLSLACPLKTRSYLAMGLPTFGSFPDVFPDTFPYYSVGSVNLRSLLSAALTYQGIPRDQVALAAHPLINKQSLLFELYLRLADQLGGSNSALPT